MGASTWVRLVTAAAGLAAGLITGLGTTILIRRWAREDRAAAWQREDALRWPRWFYTSLVAEPALHDKARNKLIAAARAGEYLDPAQAMRVRVIEYEIPGRDGDDSGELIALITTITDPALASA